MSIATYLSCKPDNCKLCNSMEMADLGACLNEIPTTASCSCVSFGDSRAKSSICKASDDEGCAVWFDIDRAPGHWVPIQIELTVANPAWNSEAKLLAETYTTEEAQDCNCLTLGQNGGTIPACYGVNISDSMQRVQRSSDREKIDIANFSRSPAFNSTVLVRFNSTGLCQDISSFRVTNRYLTMNAATSLLNPFGVLLVVAYLMVQFVAG